MLFSKGYSRIVVLLLFSACSGKQQVRKISIAEFFKTPVKSSFQVSPDGRYVSFLKTSGKRQNIFVQRLGDQAARQLTSETQRDVVFHFWAGNNELFYLRDKMAGEDPSLFAVELGKGSIRKLISFKNTRIRFISTEAHNNQFLVALNKRDSTVFDAYRLDIKTGKLSILVSNPGNITQWFEDSAGKLRMAIASDGVNETLLYRDTENEYFRPLLTNNFKTSVLPVGFSPDNRFVYALSNQGRDKMALIEIDCATGREHREIYSNPEVDVSEASYSKTSGGLIYAGYETSRRERHYLDPEIMKSYQRLEKLLPNTEIKITGRDSAEKKFIIRTYTDRDPGTFYLYTPANDKLVKLSDINSFVSTDEMCSMKAVKYKARDGLLIHGYLTVPLGSTGKGLPVVVLPHGGPASRNSWGYNAEVQFLANRGYAVFQMNFRGSTGYGKKFWIAGFKQWGGKIQDDITDGVKWLIHEGIADPGRIAIYGSSFGGYSAMHGLCFQSDLYACGASYSGLTNLFTYLKGVPAYYRPYKLMRDEMIGNPETDADYFRAVSPVFHADRIKTPVLIAQGGKDPRVNLNETNQFVRELRKHKVSVMYIVKDNEGHFFRQEENRLEFYAQLEKFLEKNLRNR